MYIYICMTEYGVKIGRTIHLKNRMRELRGTLWMYKEVESQVEYRIIQSLKDLGIQPIKGKEYFDPIYLGLVCDLLRWEYFCSKILYFNTLWDLTYVPRGGGDSIIF